jgi:hypothetical protein
MTLLKDGRDRQIQCDYCTTTTEVYDTDDFDMMLGVAKDEGWEISIHGTTWTHKCPACRHGGLDRQRKLLGL